MVYFIFDNKALIFYETSADIAQWIIKTDLFFFSRFIFDNVLIVQHAVLILKFDSLCKVLLIILLKIILFVIIVVRVAGSFLDLPLR